MLRSVQGSAGAEAGSRDTALLVQGRPLSRVASPTPAPLTLPAKGCVTRSGRLQLGLRFALCATFSTARAAAAQSSSRILLCHADDQNLMARRSLQRVDSQAVGNVRAT